MSTAALALLTEYAFFSPEVTQKRLLSLISMGRPATTPAGDQIVFVSKNGKDAALQKYGPTQGMQLQKYGPTQGMHFAIGNYIE